MNYLEEFAQDMGLNEDQVKQAEQAAEQLLEEAGDDPEALTSLSKMADGFIPKGLGDQMKGTAGIVIAAMLAQEAVNAVRDGIGSVKDSRAKAQAYKNMIATNPHLRNEDAKKVHQLFNTLYTFNPQYSADPLVSGSFVSQGLETHDTPGGILPQVNNLTMARKNIGGRQTADTFVRDLLIKNMASGGPQRKPTKLSPEVEPQMGSMFLDGE